MLTTLSIGVLSSIAAELITWLNKKLASTVLHGRGAFLLALVIAIIGAAIKAGITPGFDWSVPHLGTTFASIWATAEIFFVMVIETFGLDVQESAPNY